jgi:hypothetical protein
MLKIAYCFYGQPRNWENGIKNIMNFIKKNSLDVDFYYHAYVHNDNEIMETSPWRTIDKNTLKGDSQIIEKLNSILNPVQYSYDNPITFDLNIYQNTIAYKNTDSSHKKNINNILSQIYSISKVCELFKNHNNANINKYDFVITSRFDYLSPIIININELNKNNIYFSGLHYPRIIIPGNLWIISPEKYIKVFCFYDKLYELFNNDYILNFMKKYNENYFIGAEQIMTAVLIYCKEIGNVIYDKKILDFR